MDSTLPFQPFPGQSAKCRATKKRRQNSKDDKLHFLTQNRDGLQNRKPRLRTAHKLRMMKVLVAAMEYQLQDLQSKWVEQIPDPHTRVTAQRCALEKYGAKQSEIARRELQEMFQQHQFLLASLQTSVLRNSLHSIGTDMLKELHFDTRLGREPEEREWVLNEHNRRSIATVPSIVEKFSQMAIDKALTKHQINSPSCMTIDAPS
ncbi:hypothetical protein PF005_g20851 [Phytophthora fragariae]|uniref:Uncharacterized protein n=1 Tax=Phytophthora fragariae TaxID=53985 RepID=A0A6A3EDX0_9STRA|nr:hypothetical protein PF003_g23714 [Phytophthora fragariae]KAE8928348.1 hypothetical protein PF009_g21507 [Phytophthora fragariae]KAE8987258.1 hypothetical protein PF011_g19649 [Phytophthora fragariae]KAE9087030.1 hypothetical protein PF010_g19879 [Phytophthora fragariae]KAE9087035.1 hypothetical protein PF007_g20530 [Phytophthora fragariae]